MLQSGPSSPDKAQTSPLESSETVTKVQSLMRARDDTSRFVGLAFLKAVLDNSGLESSPSSPLSDNLLTIWTSISATFLDRLLRAPQSPRFVRGEAKDMLDLAVAIIHRFVVLLPTQMQEDEKANGRLEALISALVDCSPQTAELILQILRTEASTIKGAMTILQAQDLSPLIEIAPQQSLALDVFEASWANASTDPARVPQVQKHIDSVMPHLIVCFKDTDAVTLVNFVGSVIPKLPAQAIPHNPSWLSPLVYSIQKLVTIRPTKAGRLAYTTCAANLLQVYPSTCPRLIFSSSKTGEEGKPFSYFLINLLLIDLRASFPSLLSNLNTPEYPSISLRLAAAYDVITSFVGFLLESLGDSDEEDDNDEIALAIPPDLLLKLRRDIAETMSLSVEYLRDRWDASMAGAAGLHPEARSGKSQGQHLALTWDSGDSNFTHDHLILSAIRALALWLREDDNDALRRESAGLNDMFVALYKASSQPYALDFRHPILAALEAILQTSEGAASLVAQGGWEVLAEDLTSIVMSLNRLQEHKQLLQNSDYSRGIDLIRVLLDIVEDASTTECRPEWLQLVRIAAGIAPFSPEVVLNNPSVATAVELHSALLQLCVALLSKTNRDERRRCRDAALALSGAAQLLQASTRANGYGNSSDGELRELLSDVVVSLEKLQI